MSEALDGTTLINSYAAPQSRLKFTPDSLLTDSLQQFIRRDDGTEDFMGHDGLFLFADDPIRSQNAHSNGIARRGGIESAAVASLGNVLRQRRSQHRQLGTRLQLTKLPETHPGIAVRLDVILDELTAAALLSHMPIHPDRSVSVHMNVRRQQLVTRPEYFAACRGLYEQLTSGGRRPGIIAIDLIRQAPRP